MSTTDVIRAHILAEYLPGTPSDELDPRYDLLDNGVVDSLALVQLVEWVQQRFQISTEEVEISPDDFRSVDAIGAFVQKAMEHR